MKTIMIYTCIILIIIVVFYNLIYKDISLVGKHTNNIRKLLDKDLDKQSNKSYYYGSFYYLSIFSYGVLLKGYNKSKNMQYIAYLIESLCVFIKLVFSLIIASYCIAIIIVFNKIFK